MCLSSADHYGHIQELKANTDTQGGCFYISFGNITEFLFITLWKNCRSDRGIRWRVSKRKIPPSSQTEGMII